MYVDNIMIFGPPNFFVHVWISCKGHRSTYFYRKPQIRVHSLQKAVDVLCYIPLYIIFTLGHSAHTANKHNPKYHVSHTSMLQY
jgi:hypothetical protein